MSEIQNRIENVINVLEQDTTKVNNLPDYIDMSETTALPGDIRRNKIAFGQGEKLLGTAEFAEPNKSVYTGTLSAYQYGEISNVDYQSKFVYWRQDGVNNQVFKINGNNLYFQDYATDTSKVQTLVHNNPVCIGVGARNCFKENSCLVLVGYCDIANVVNYYIDVYLFDFTNKTFEFKSTNDTIIDMPNYRYLWRNISVNPDRALFSFPTNAQIIQMSIQSDYSLRYVNRVNSTYSTDDWIIMCYVNKYFGIRGSYGKNTYNNSAKTMSIGLYTNSTFNITEDATTSVILGSYSFIAISPNGNYCIFSANSGDYNFYLYKVTYTNTGVASLSRLMDLGESWTSYVSGFLGYFGFVDDSHFVAGWFEHTGNNKFISQPRFYTIQGNSASYTSGTYVSLYNAYGAYCILTKFTGSGSSTSTNYSLPVLNGSTITESFTFNSKDFIDTSDANATADSILSGKTAYVNGTKVTGTMANNGTINITPSTSQQTIPAGYTSGGTVSAVDNTIDANIVAGNIKKDVTILGVTGTYESSGGMKTFDSIEDMDADPDCKIGDTCVVLTPNVYKTFAEFPKMSSIYAPETITLEEPIDIVNSRSISSDGWEENFAMQFFISNNIPTINVSYSNMNTYTNYIITYQSNDGQEWTRTQIPDTAINDVFTFPASIDWSTVNGYSTFDLMSVFGQYINDFKGIYKANSVNDNGRAYYLSVANNEFVVNNEHTVDDTDIVTNAIVAKNAVDTSTLSSKYFSICYNPTTNEYLFIITKNQQHYHVANNSYIATYQDNLYICSDSRYSTGAWQSETYDIYKVIVNGNTSTVTSSEKITTHDLQYDDTSNYSYRFIQIPSGYYYIDGYSTIYLDGSGYNDDNVHLCNDTRLRQFSSPTTASSSIITLSTPIPQKGQYSPLQTQFTLSDASKLYVGQVAFGATGEIIGTNSYTWEEIPSDITKNYVGVNSWDKLQGVRVSKTSSDVNMIYNSGFDIGVPTYQNSRGLTEAEKNILTTAYPDVTSNTLNGYWSKITLPSDVCPFKDNNAVIYKQNPYDYTYLYYAYGDENGLTDFVRVAYGNSTDYKIDNILLRCTNNTVTVMDIPNNTTDDISTTKGDGKIGLSANKRYLYSIYYHGINIIDLVNKTSNNYSNNVTNDSCMTLFCVDNTDIIVLNNNGEVYRIKPDGTITTIATVTSSMTNYFSSYFGFVDYDRSDGTYLASCMKYAIKYNPNTEVVSVASDTSASAGMQRNR